MIVMPLTELYVGYKQAIRGRRMTRSRKWSHYNLEVALVADCGTAHAHNHA